MVSSLTLNDLDLGLLLLLVGLPIRRLMLDGGVMVVMVMMQLVQYTSEVGAASKQVKICSWCKHDWSQYRC